MSWDLRCADNAGPEGLAALADRSVDVIATDPPYSEHVHAKSRRGLTVTHVGGAKDEISERRDLGFEAITQDGMEAAADQFARLARRWVLVFCDQESAHLWRGALTSAGLEYLRTCAWHKIGGAPQFTGDRPAVWGEAIVCAHQPGRKRWNGGGKQGLYSFPTAIDRDRSGLDLRMHTTFRSVPKTTPHQTRRSPTPEAAPMIAALFVATGGCYYNLPDVDPWDEKRDARLYAGPWPVVAHPPCERWGRYWSGGPSARVRREKGDDDGCFTSALASVRKWGGVLEHPEASHAWRAHGLNAPPKDGWWITAGDGGGWTCCVEQGHYGHRARKATWLYAFGVDLPSLKWGPCAKRARLNEGFHSAEERAFRSNRSLSPEMRLRKSEWMTATEKATGIKDFRRLTLTERKATPPAFRDLLLNIARTAQARAA